MVITGPCWYTCNQAKFYLVTQSYRHENRQQFSYLSESVNCVIIQTNRQTDRRCQTISSHSHTNTHTSVVQLPQSVNCVITQPYRQTNNQLCYHTVTQNFAHYIGKQAYGQIGHQLAIKTTSHLTGSYLQICFIFLFGLYVSIMYSYNL